MSVAINRLVAVAPYHKHPQRGLAVGWALALILLNRGVDQLYLAVSSGRLIALSAAVVLGR